MFLSSTCCGAWLYCYTAVDLCVGFRVGDLDSGVVLTRHRSHIKSLFISMLYQIWNLKYSRHLRITNFVGLEPFIFAINLDAVLSFTIFSTLVSVFRCTFLFRINKISLVCYQD